MKKLYRIEDIKNPAWGPDFQPAESAQEALVLAGIGESHVIIEEIDNGFAITLHIASKVSLAAAELGRKGGRAKSPLKTEKCRINGQGGGRPKKEVFI